MITGVNRTELPKGTERMHKYALGKLGQEQYHCGGLQHTCKQVSTFVMAAACGVLRNIFESLKSGWRDHPFVDCLRSYSPLVLSPGSGEALGFWPQQNIFSSGKA